jgi:hypothetical protein
MPKTPPDINISMSAIGSQVSVGEPQATAAVVIPDIVAPNAELMEEQVAEEPQATAAVVIPDIVAPNAELMEEQVAEEQVAEEEVAEEEVVEEEVAEEEVAEEEESNGDSAEVSEVSEESDNEAENIAQPTDGLIGDKTNDRGSDSATHPAVETKSSPDWHALTEQYLRHDQQPLISALDSTSEQEYVKIAKIGGRVVKVAQKAFLQEALNRSIK